MALDRQQVIEIRANVGSMFADTLFLRNRSAILFDNARAGGF
jgi:hypothetical protein